MQRINFTPVTDGIDHINVYSKGKTELGRWLSNFTYAPAETEDGIFHSVEGYWYWLGCKDERLRTSVGFEAKKIGRECGASDWIDDEEFKIKIKIAISEKIYNSRYALDFANSSIPFTHYYEYAGKIVLVPKAAWILNYLEFERRRLYIHFGQK